MELGIVGLPNVGKSTLFNALAGTSVACSNYPFCTVDSNTGVVNVPDSRLERLGELLAPETLTPTTLRFVDIAGLVKGASAGEGLGNRFLANIRDVDAIAHVVRCFEDSSIAHVEGNVDPERDIDIVNTELLLADLDTLERAVEKRKKEASRGDSEAKDVLPTLTAARDAVEKGVTVRGAGLSERDLKALSHYGLLTAKDVLYVANVSEDAVGEGENDFRRRIARACGEPEWKVVTVAASLEAELAGLEPEELSEFLAGWQIAEPGLMKLVRAGYRLLDLVTFFTIKGTEVRAWTVTNGTTVSEAAGKIHSDMEKGFIKAEVAAYEDLVEAGSMHEARDAGHVRTEGRDNIVRDGDVILVHFH